MNKVKAGSGWEHLLEIARIEGLNDAYTWNPAIGCNNYDCEVCRRGKCWAMSMAKRFGWNFEPHLIPERLDEPLKLETSAVITPVSMGDIFGLTLHDFMAIWEIMETADYHVYALLTKLPQYAFNYMPLRSSARVWLGVTVNSQEDVWRLKLLRKHFAPDKKYCLFEPLYGPINFDLSWLDLIVIGPQNYPLVQPKKEWVDSIIKHAGTARVFFKSKLKLDSEGFDAKNS